MADAGGYLKFFRVRLWLLCDLASRLFVALLVRDRSRRFIGDPFVLGLRRPRCDAVVWLPVLMSFVFAMGGPMLHAQSPAALQSVRFSVFSAQPIKDVAFAPRAGAAPLTLTFQPTARSVRYEYRGSMPLRFVDATTGAPVAEANIPAGIQNALLLFSPVEAGKGSAAGLRYQIAVLDDGAGRHGAGALAIINFSGLALTGKVNNQNLTLKPGLNPSLSVGRTATIKLSTIFKQRSYQSYAGTVTLGRNERALLILFPPFYAGALEVQSRLLVDQPPAAAPVVR